ncbi:MAG: VWA domain-containing protein [Saprospiraceae bacterium]
MNKSRLLFLLFVLIHTSFSPPRGGGKTEAYQHYFKGAYYYGEERFQAALGHFRQAYAAVPEEFNFALSLGLCLSRLGKAEEGLDIISTGEKTIRETDPDFKKKQALKYFIEGMIYLYGEQYYKAIPLIRTSIKFQEEIKKNKTLSIFYNALGYAQMMDQGKNTHKKNNMGPHLHVHSRDMIRSRDNFEKALLFDGYNQRARYNYKILSDSLKLTQDVQMGSLAEEDKDSIEIHPTYKNLPYNASQLKAFTEYDEVVFLLDISGSMVMEKVTCKGQTRFQVMKETALYMLEVIDPAVKVGIGTIGGDCGTVPRLWIPVGSRSRKDLKYDLEFLVPDGTTPLLNILQETPALFTKGTGKRRSIFFISDGANICRAGGVDICEWSERLLQKNITLNILTFLYASLDNTNAFAEYTCLAENTEGEILYLDVNRCRLKPFAFNLIQSCQLEIPELKRVDCWGPAVKDLWGVFLE